MDHRQLRVCGGATLPGTMYTSMPKQWHLHFRRSVPVSGELLRSAVSAKEVHMCILSEGTEELQSILQEQVSSHIGLTLHRDTTMQLFSKYVPRGMHERIPVSRRQRNYEH